tara:strand:+ start:1280 stop:1726 length:447 start_codon:yes stop_codon:yes gene_type:complete
MQRSSLDNWKNNLTDSKEAPPILLNNLDTTDENIIVERLKKEFDSFDQAYLTVQRWEFGCYIPWHNDGKYNYSSTIYLNPKWHHNDGGQFVYKLDNSDEFYSINESYTPEFNSAVVVKNTDKGHYHLVTPILTQDKTRITIQFFAYHD